MRAGLITFVFLLGVCSTAFPTQGQERATVEKEAAQKVQDQTVPPELDRLAQLQWQANQDRKAAWGHWGNNPADYHAWRSHSNRLIPVYTFGASLEPYIGANSIYRREPDLRKLYGRVPNGTLNPQAEYADQTDIYRLQKAAIEAGNKKYVFLVVFDGMDWQTTWAAALYHSQQVHYRQGRGTGLHFQDYRGVETDYGFIVTSPYADDCQTDVDAQQIKVPWKSRGGYNADLGGAFPWSRASEANYLLGKLPDMPDSVTDSSSSATSLTAGIKTFNGAINVTHDCRQVEPIANWVQRERGFSVGAISSVPISHATPAAAYANNVSRDDYQDLTRDMLGLPSVAHRQHALPGLDVVIGTGWGIQSEKPDGQGANFIPGNPILTDEDKRASDVRHGGRYHIAERTAGRAGAEVLGEAAHAAAAAKQRLLGFFGTAAGHLPFRTGNGDYRPTRDVKELEQYKPEDLTENPTLEQMTEAAIQVLATNPKGFWLMVESGDVDWANHSNNLDNSIGAVLSGDAAFHAIVQWIEKQQAWEQSLVIVTADHGHYFHLLDPEAIANATKE